MSETLNPAMAKRIEVWPIEKIVPYEKNARTHNDEQVGQIASSILEFGFVNPILVDIDDGIIAGHGRLLAAKSMDLKEVPVVVLDHLSPTQRKAYVIADNKIALNAGWDIDLLNSEIEGLGSVDFDTSLLGFSEDELEGLAEDGWVSDIDSLGKQDENVEGINSKITIRVDQTFKEEIQDAVTKYCDEHDIEVEIS